MVGFVAQIFLVMFSFSLIFKSSLLLSVVRACIQASAINSVILKQNKQLHLNLDKPLQKYAAYSLLLSPSGSIWRTSFMYLRWPCSWARRRVRKVSAELHFV